MTLLATSTAKAGGTTFSLSGGTSTLTAELPGFGLSETGDWGVSVGTTVGYLFNNLFRIDVVDLEFGNSDQGAGLTTSRLSLGPGIRFGIFSRDAKWQPYVYAGIGGTRFSIGGTPTGTVSDWAFEWSLGGGVEYAIDRGAVGVKYRYRSSPSLFDDLIDVTLSQHSIGLEFSYIGLAL